MRAQIINNYGGPEVFTNAEIPDPVAGAGQVSVRVAYAAVNPLDWKIRSGALSALLPIAFPAVLGNEISGVVEAVGPGVIGMSVGDRVAGFVPSGAYAEFAVTSANRLAVVPKGLPLEQAATLPTAAETAQRALALIEVQPGETVVVNAAAGSVGSAVVQLLVAAGARVIGTASPVNHDYVRALGATPIRYGEHLLSDLAESAPTGVDAAFDGGARGFIDQILTLVPAERVVTIVDFAAGAKGVNVAGGDPTALTADTITATLHRAAERRFAVEVAGVFPLNAVADAHRASENAHLRGKLLVKVADLDEADPVTFYGGGATGRTDSAALSPSTP